MNRIRKSVPGRAVRRLLKELAGHSADVLEQRVLLSASTVLPANAGSPPATESTLDSAFEPAEFAKIADQLG